MKWKPVILWILAFHYAFRLKVEQLTYYIRSCFSVFSPPHHLFIIPSVNTIYIIYIPIYTYIYLYIRQAAENILWKCKLFSLDRIIMVRWKHCIPIHSTTFPLVINHPRFLRNLIFPEGLRVQNTPLLSVPSPSSTTSICISCRVLDDHPCATNLVLRAETEKRNTQTGPTPYLYKNQNA